MWACRSAAFSQVTFHVHVEAVKSCRQSCNVASDKYWSAGVGLREENLSAAAPAFSIAATAAKNRQGHEWLKILQTQYNASDLIQRPYRLPQRIWVSSWERSTRILNLFIPCNFVIVYIYEYQQLHSMKYISLLQHHSNMFR